MLRLFRKQAIRRKGIVFSKMKKNKKIRAVLILAIATVVLYLFNLLTSRIVSRDVGGVVANTISALQFLSFGFALAAILLGFLAISIKNKGALKKFFAPKKCFWGAAAGLAMYLVLMLSFLPYLVAYPNWTLGLSSAGTNYAKAQDGDCGWVWDEERGEWVHYCNGFLLWDIPQEGASDLRDYDELLGAENGIKENCPPDASPYFNATYHLYYSVEWDEEIEPWWAEVGCGKTIPFEELDYVVESFKRNVRGPGVYFSQDRCEPRHVNNGVPYWHGEASFLPERSGPINDPRFKGIGSDGRLKSIKIINDALNETYYGVIFNAASTGAGMCSEPIINTTLSPRCFNLAEGFVPHSVAIFTWDGDFGNKQQRQQGISIYGLPVKSPDDEHYEQYYREFGKDEIIDEITDEETGYDEAGFLKGYWAIDMPVEDLLREEGRIQKTTSFPQPVPQFSQLESEEPEEEEPAEEPVEEPVEEPNEENNQQP